ncbi:hypothetical protein JW916_11835 [Candidatus Sumerlaeota bacterium]|nr:hypothetical protein [Candidatus Sumerlaeota bacterium]
MSYAEMIRFKLDDPSDARTFLRNFETDPGGDEKNFGDLALKDPAGNPVERQTVFGPASDSPPANVSRSFRLNQGCFLDCGMLDASSWNNPPWSPGYKYSYLIMALALAKNFTFSFWFRNQAPDATERTALTCHEAFVHTPAGKTMPICGGITVTQSHDPAAATWTATVNFFRPAWNTPTSPPERQFWSLEETGGPAWHHYILRRIGNRIETWCDNVRVTASCPTWTEENDHNSDPLVGNFREGPGVRLYLGCDRDRSSGSFADGQMADFRFFPFAVTTDEIAALYNAGDAPVDLATLARFAPSDSRDRFEVRSHLMVGDVEHFRNAKDCTHASVFEVNGAVDIMGEVGVDKSVLTEGNFVARKSLPRFVDLASVSNVRRLTSDRKSWVCGTASPVTFYCSPPYFHNGDLIEGIGCCIGANGFAARKPTVKMWLMTNGNAPGGSEEFVYYVDDQGVPHYYSTPTIDETIDQPGRWFQIERKLSTEEMQLVRVNPMQSFNLKIEMNPGDGTVYVTAVYVLMRSKIY